MGNGEKRNRKRRDKYGEVKRRGVGGEKEREKRNERKGKSEKGREKKMLICNLTVACWEKILGLVIGIECDFKELDCKIVTEGCTPLNISAIMGVYGAKNSNLTF